MPLWGGNDTFFGAGFMRAGCLRRTARVQPTALASSIHVDASTGSQLWPCRQRRMRSGTTAKAHRHDDPAVAIAAAPTRLSVRSTPWTHTRPRQRPRRRIPPAFLGGPSPRDRHHPSRAKTATDTNTLLGRRWSSPSRRSSFRPAQCLLAEQGDHRNETEVLHGHQGRRAHRRRHQPDP